MHFHNLSAGGLLSGETSGRAKIPKEAVESLVTVLEVMVAEKEMESSIPTPEVIVPEKEMEHPVLLTSKLTYKPLVANSSFGKNKFEKLISP